MTLNSFQNKKVDQGSKRFNTQFFQGDVCSVARDLLGAVLFSESSKGQLCAGMIIETEAYDAKCDEACHAYQRRTQRNEAMFKQGGISYVYTIYGMYQCINVVTGHEGHAAAVLIRALIPLEGLEHMLARRIKRRKSKKLLAEHQICAGPGMICDAMGISKADNFVSLVSSRRVWLEPYQDFSDEQVRQTSRIGISKGLELPWRYVVTEYERRYCAGRPAVEI